MVPVGQPDGTTQYEISVRSTAGDVAVYRTIQSLDESGNSHLLGRGTRVWKAVRVQDGRDIGSPVALKDAWVEGSRQREGSIC